MKALWYDMDIGKAVALQVGKLFTRNAAFSPFSPFHYGDIPEPAIPNPRWLKVKNIRCGLCASDVHLIFMDISPKVFPAAVPGGSRAYLGHELVGEIVELGSEVEGFALGDRPAGHVSGGGAGVRSSAAVSPFRQPHRPGRIRCRLQHRRQ